MTIVILESASSATAPLKYSTDKLQEGGVSILCSANLPDDLPSTAKEAFLEREEHPALSRKAKRLAFHVAFNPDVSDTITVGQIPDCIHEWMEKMGYGEQPYIVFRHNDIEREHYHIVSTNILPTGRVIRSCFSEMRCLKAGKELGLKYGFVMGKKEKKEALVRSVEELMGPKLIFLKGAPVREQFTAIVRRAHEFNYESYSQFLAILASFGMKTHTVKRKNGEWGLDAYAADEYGNKISRLYGIDKMLKGDIFSDFRKRRDENVARGTEANERDAMMAAASVRCLEWARSFEEYRAMIRFLGFDIQTFRNPDGVLEDLSIVDKAYRRVESVSAFEPSLTAERLAAIIDSAEWRNGPKNESGQLYKTQIISLNEEVQARFDAMWKKTHPTIAETRPESESESTHIHLSR